MPCYRFIIHASDYTYDDPDGELFVSETAARDHARRIIRELWEDGFDPSSILNVTDELGYTVDSIPFWMASFDEKPHAYACPALAETNDSPERKALWLKRAQYLGELALKTAERLLESVKSGRDATTR